MEVIYMRLDNVLPLLTTLQSAPIWIALTTPPLCWVLSAIYNGFMSPLAGKWLGHCELSRTQSLNVGLTIVPLGKHLYGTANVTMKADVEYTRTFFINEKLVPNNWVTVNLNSTKEYLDTTLKIKLQGSKLSGTISVTTSSDVVPKDRIIVLDKISNII